MSHTPILAFGLGSRPLSPLGGGNVAAMQHEGRVGSLRPARSLRGEERCGRAPLGGHHPSWRGPRPWKGGRGPRGSRPPAGRSASAPDARRPPGDDTGSPDRTSRDGWWPGSSARGTGGLAAEARAAAEWRTPGHLAGVPATRAGMRTELGTTPRRFGGESPPAGSWSLDSGLRGSAPAASSQGRPREGLISGTAAAAAPGGRGDGGGRLAPRPGDRPGGPGLGPPQPPPLGAGDTRSGCARRGRKLSVLGGKHHNKRPSSAGARPPRRSPASNLPPAQPAPLPRTRRPLCGRAAAM
ncbi:unnamed protein product [Pipistrellus nathusii]|uniref:Uncharacterized protein n=1 Tax=Pipistrellus nathusii TaxID=59473 RepID=A0ABN9ZFQ3_PIPNA